MGSSPLTRGKPRAENDDEYLPGLIPAHAGKTCFWSCPRAASRAHPRSRGENEKAGIPASLGAGSSPLTRGKPPYSYPARGRWRLIPAHAGKTAFADVMSITNRAHPRSRGENGKLDGTKHTLVGSSPLTRGKRGGPTHPDKRRGLIPAHAGKTNFPASMVIKPGAHPRSRGENIVFRLSV